MLMDYWWITWPVGFWLLAALGGMAPLFLLCVIPLPFKDVHESESVYARIKGQIDEDWLAGEGFVRAGTGIALGIPVIGWRHESEPIYFVAYGSTASMDFVSVFQSMGGLTTGKARGGLTAPPEPGSFMQVFPGASLEALWEHHLAAESELRRLGHAMYAAPLTLKEAFTESVRSHCRYLSLRPWLWLMVPYWFVVRQTRWAGVSVPRQIERGWVDGSRRADGGG